MNTFSLEDYRKTAVEALKGTGAFLRISRGEGLFVTDAKRRNMDISFLKEKLPAFEFSEINGLVYLTPSFGFSDETNGLLTLILKSCAEKREKLIRQHLAKALRLKNQEQIVIFTMLYERMIHS